MALAAVDAATGERQPYGVVKDGDLPADETAPYGRRADGTPYKMDPETRAKISATFQGATGSFQNPNPLAGKKAPEKAPRPRPRASGPTTPGYDRDAVAEGLARVVEDATAALLVGSFAMPALAADAAAVSLYGPGIAEALADIGEMNPAIARVLTAVTKTSAYAALAAAVLPLVVQLAVNHGILPALPLPGIRTPEELSEALAERAGRAED